MTDTDALVRETADELPRIELLPDDAFLRHLPRTLDASQRHDLEAVVLAADCVSICLNRIIYLCHTVALNPEDISTTKRAEMFSSVWSIVDNLDVIYTLLLRATKSKGPKTDSLMANLKINREIRNWRQHLRERLGNAINQKGLRWPLFGAISFGTMLSSTGGRAITEPLAERARGHMILAGSLGGNDGSVRLIGGDDIKKYFGNIMRGPYFHVRNDEIDLMLVHQQIVEYLNFTSKTFEHSIVAQAEKCALEEGISLERLLEPVRVFDFIYDLDR
jgi:hypothetical protein